MLIIGLVVIGALGACVVKWILSTKNRTEQQAKEAMLYMSITGNPTHLGHMAAFDRAIKYLKDKKGIPVARATISLANQGYYGWKCDENELYPLTLDQRIMLLKGAIDQAKKEGMFKDVEVTFCSLETDGGGSDHVPVYKKLRAQYKGQHKLYFVAGEDLCRNKCIRNWPGSIKRAIVIKREIDGQDSSIPWPKINKNQVRFYIKPSKGSPYSGLSSTKIRNGIALSPPKLDAQYRAMLPVKA